ncbi:MAG: magnesium transporter, partial [Bdellovibrionales bacterium]|nr:magnesium transporter [Bdellovibrionales bacterium]
MAINSVNSQIIKRLLGGRNNRPLKSILRKLEEADLAQLFPILNDRETRYFVEALMAVDKAAGTLRQLPPPQIQDILRLLEPQKIGALLSYCPEDDGTHILEILGETERDHLMTFVDPARARRLKQLLSFPVGTAGRDMVTQIFSLPMEMTAENAIVQIRSRSHEESIYYIYCVDLENRLVGVTSLRALVTAPEGTTLESLMKRDLITIGPNTSSQVVAELVAKYDFIAIPVVSAQMELLGLITVDDVLDIVQEQATADIYAAAGLTTDDRVYSSPLLSIKNRLPWNLINLGTAVLASTVVSRFEATLSQLIVLATLNNIVAGMGGNAAIQAMTVMTRGLATGDFKFTTFRKAFFKELRVGLVIGTIMGITSAAVIYVWHKNIAVSAVLGLSLLLNSFLAAVVGSV